MEVEATVADYLHMLLLELSGQTYSKTAHRQALLVKNFLRSEQQLLASKPLSLLAVEKLGLLKSIQRNFTFIACMSSENLQKCLICRVLLRVTA